MKADYDLVILGGGSAGYAAAQTGAKLGLQVALVEEADKMGGLCILRGCMPSKTLIETANRMRDIREAAEFGITVPPGARVEGAALLARRQRLGQSFQDSRLAEMRKGDFAILRGRGRFLSEHKLALHCGDEQELTFRTAIIATGSEPRLPDIEGLAKVPFWMSEDALQVEDIPERLLVVGGGAIGCEMGHCFEGLGSAVTLCQRSGNLLSHFPEEAGRELVAASRARGIHVLLNCETRSVQPRPRGEGIMLNVNVDGQARTLEGDQLLIATGRKPRIADLGLKEIGIVSDEHGIKADGKGHTSLPHIFAVGDCADGVDIVHHAVIEGEQAARNAHALLHGDALSDADTTPTVFAVFSHPEVIHIGPSAHKLAQRSDLVTRRVPLEEVGKALIRGIDTGFVQVFLEKDSDRLIAATGVGRGAVDFSHTLVVAIRAGMTMTEFLRIPHYHPTLAESWTYLES
ncbi:dihydrolipoyl dehydrogenase family protein [Roseibacillus ishigakijimensis]|uniref:NAD(P)/FAD-dependent oxidoreductase n=1 Tax=Roseibacillus ishigakijimensis TaxID=454146 RepID=A0A934RTX7_9BACT|nr:NAD(P)/FAD-dependent oxidoreductase [Roseibacillus ishigakijimensis]MBK1835363.1 NAD(P)/FAD-dependent oxidoreductase [Roseibacillus ishigakijimensis]